MTTIYGDEEYKCGRCNENFEYGEIRSDWCCPKYHHPVGIKAIIKDNNYYTIRIKPHQLKEGDLLRLHGDMVFEVINCKLDYFDQNIYRIALKEYTVVEKNKDEYVEIINGGWY